jgi:hypothetical protein
MKYPQESPQDRKEIADNLKEILSAWPDRGYCRAFARCVLGNFRTHLLCIPKFYSGHWHPRGRRHYRN